MKTSDFYYDLPKELIAQTPVEPRDSSRLLVLDRSSGSVEHRRFSDIIDYLNEGDLIVANDSRVLPARIYGIKDETGARVEFLLLRQISGNRWETLCKPGKKAREGAHFTFGDGLLTATVAGAKEGDTIAIISPSSPTKDSTAVPRGKAFLESLGYNVILGKHVDEWRGNYIAASEEARAEDLNEMFARKDVDMILCARGGYGALQFVNRIDFENIKANPKRYINIKVF